MAATTEGRIARRQFQDTNVDVKIVLSALWVAMLFVFAYVDIFAYLRADVLQAALVGQVATTGFAVDQSFLSLTLAYILLPAAMVVASLLLKPRLNRIINLTVSVIYALTIIAAAIGETWMYYLIGSLAELAVLAVIARTAWTWPPPDPATTKA
jgi:hypothetical protein